MHVPAVEGIHRSSRGPPPAKRVRLSARQTRAREESGLLHLLQDSTREMAHTCTRPHLDLSKPSIAFAVSLGNDLETMLPPRLQIVAKARFYQTDKCLHNVGHGGNFLLHLLFEKQGVLERNIAFFFVLPLK